ncbi:MAG TPA: dTMP kinase [Acidobacteriota bacterium]|nr:dTMP kinase [Acidobacteriota bacterium]
MKKGKFITFEGIEGSGKTLQLSRVEDELVRRGIPSLTTLEPGGTKFGAEVREVLLRAEGADREPVAELLLYLADRFQHLKEVVEPALAEDLVVLSDRYHDATLAYQGHARSVGLKFIDALAQQLGLITPDLTLVFDIDVPTGLSRARERNRITQNEAQGRFEEESLNFHRRVREGYLLLAHNAPGRIQIVEGSGTPEEVFARTWAIVAKKLEIGH